MSVTSVHPASIYTYIDSSAQASLAASLAQLTIQNTAAASDFNPALTRQGSTELLPPIPSSTPPKPTIWARGDGRGHTTFGNMWRLAVSVQRRAADMFYGPLDGAKTHELANRSEDMTSGQMCRLFAYFATMNPHFYFSPFMSIMPIQNITEENLTEHLSELLREIPANEKTAVAFPIYFKSKDLFDAEHMTMFLAINGKLEFHDAKGISITEYRWHDDVNINKVASIIQKKLNIKSAPLENRYPHQSCIYMCGLFGVAWVYQRAILGKTQKEWIEKISTTTDEQMRLEINQLLHEAPKDWMETVRGSNFEAQEKSKALESCEQEELIFEFDEDSFTR